MGDLARALEAMRGRLQGEEAARQAFLGTAAHELRTPLALLLTTVELLGEALDAPVPDVTSARTRAVTAARQTRRLARLATDLLDLTRLDGRAGLRHEPVDLREIVAAVHADFGPRAREAGVELRLEGAGAWAWADAPAVARIVGVLLDNALRYGAAGGSVTTTVTKAEDTAVLRVADGGRGLAPGEHARVFGRFERGAAGDHAAGFGLGLAIGRELALRMGGQLTTVAVERGACFALTLPAARNGIATGVKRDPNRALATG